MSNHDIMRKEPLRVTTPDGLEELIGLIHDEYFDLPSVEFSPSAHLVKIPYRRIFHRGPRRTVRNWIVFRTDEVDVIRALITVRNVQDYAFKDSAHIETFSFNEVSYDGRTLRFDCCESLVLWAAVSSLDIECRDVEVRGKARIHSGILWDSSSSKVYD